MMWMFYFIFFLFIYIFDLFMHIFIYYICRYFGKLISIFPSMIAESSITANILNDTSNVTDSVFTIFPKQLEQSDSTFIYPFNIS